MTQAVNQNQLQVKIVNKYFILPYVEKEIMLKQVYCYQGVHDEKWVGRIYTTKGKAWFETLGNLYSVNFFFNMASGWGFKVFPPSTTPNLRS